MANHENSLPRALLATLAITAGVVVANNYYNQPLLHLIGSSFDAPDHVVAIIATATQLGYSVGLFLMLPLGDMLERKRYIQVLLAASCAALLVFSTASSLPIAVIAGGLIGFTSIVPQLLPPIASQLAGPKNSKAAIGLVMGGLLLGISLSRFFGGVLGDLVGWRLVYILAAGAMIILLAILTWRLPVMLPSYKGRYGALIASMAGLVERHSELRWLSAAAALQFASFGLVWTTLAFHLRAMPGQYPASAVGLIALIGSGGVIAAMLMGKVSAHIALKPLLLVAGGSMALAFILFSQAQTTLIWILPGVILLDLGMQVSHVASMARILELEPTARNRLNTIYMSTRFLGGAVGTALGGMAWNLGAWSAVCFVGAALTLAAAATITASGLHRTIATS